MQGNAYGGGEGGGGGGGGGGAFGKLAFSKLKHDPTLKKDTTESVDESVKEESDTLPEIETEDPIVKAEREFFEIIKQVFNLCLLLWPIL